MKRFIFCMAAAVLIVGGNSAMAQSSGRWNSYLDFEVRGGDREERSQSRTFIPIFQDDSSMLFGDIRMMYIEGGAWEGNFGLGHRQILSSQRVLGIYGFYDVRDTTDNNTFHQGSVGAELLDINWGLRANAYLPDTSAQLANGGNAFLQGNQILVQGNHERAYYGMDVEAEHILWRDDCTGDMEVWAAGGYFHFDNSATNFRHISGPRARVEARLYDLPVLGNDSRIVASGQYEYDDVRGSVSQGFLSVRIPLGCGGNCRPKMNLLDRRMVTPIMRDIDIVTNIAAGGPTELGMNAKTGVLLDDVVTLTALDDILGDVAGGPDERVFILDGVDGSEDIMDTIVLNDGQILIGGGGRMNVVGTMTGLPAVFTASGDAFTINQMDGGDNVINLAEDNGIYGLTLDGGSDSIFGFNPGTFEIAGNTLMNASSDLIDINGDSLTVIGCILNNTFLSNGDEAIEIDASDGADFDVDIIGNSFQMTDSDAIIIDVEDDSTFVVDIRHNRFFGQGNDGIEFEVDDNAMVTAKIQHNIFDDVNDEAIEIDANDSTVLDFKITGNTFLGRDNTEKGVDIDLDDDASLTVLINNNIFDDIDDDAIDIDLDDDSFIDAKINRNTFLGRGNTGDGIEIDLDDDAVAVFFVKHNVFDDINDDAFEIDADDDADVDLIFSGNRILGRENTSDGIDIHLDDDADLIADISNNFLRNLTSDGIDIIGHDDSDLDVMITQNKFRGISDDNIEIDANGDFDAIILDNNIRGGEFGINIDNDDGGNFLTIGGNKIRKVTDTGILIDSDGSLFLDDNGQNNKVRTRAGGDIFNIDDDGDVIGTIEINNVDRVFP